MERRDCMGSRNKGYPEVYPTIHEGAEATNINNPTSVIKMPPQNLPAQANEFNRSRSIAICMPASIPAFQVRRAEGGLFRDISGIISIDDQQFDHPIDLQQPKREKFHSRSVHAGASHISATDTVQQWFARNDWVKDEGFDALKTWSGKLEGLISKLGRNNPQEPEGISGPQFTEPEAVPTVDRYFESLEGPELDTLKESEKLILPEDKKWPFLLRFPISSFGMCLGMSCQAIMWKTLATSPSTRFLHISPIMNIILWCISVALVATVSFIYSLKIIFYFEAVRREYFHPIRINFFFAPWISCLFLSIGVPPSFAVNIHHAVWYVLMVPLFCLELKIYGQWMSGGQRRLSKVANPSNHVAIVGNFVGALLGASMGLKEGPIFFFAVGLAHYAVLFVTLCQRLPSNATLPKDLHPVFFLFVAAPSVASLAWEKITGEFGYGSRMAYSVALFLYVSLAVRINFFRGFRFSLSWWAYTIPMSSASTTTIIYATEIRHVSTQVLAVVLSGIATLTLSTLLVATFVHAFVLCDLFPNDSAIAITEKKTKPSRKRTYLRTETLDSTVTCSSVDTVTALQL